MSLFLGKSGDRTMWNLQLDLASPIGRDISDFSLHPKENEVRVGTRPHAHTPWDPSTAAEPPLTLWDPSAALR